MPRAVACAIGQLRAEHATIFLPDRPLGTSWKTLWRAIKPKFLQDLADDQARFAGVASLGVDEHLWHTSTPASAARKS